MRENGRDDDSLPARPAGSVVVIEPAARWRGLDLGEVIRYRELFVFLLWRDLKVRYHQTILGASWAVLQPFLTMVVFSVFLGRLAGIDSGGVPYPIFVYAALVPWTFFASAVTGSTTSLVANTNLITKIYCPRIIIPVAAAGSYAVDFVIALTVLGGMMAWYGIAPTAALLLLPLFVLLALAAALGVGLFLAPTNVRFRDVRYATPFLVQLWLFLSPVAYPSSLVPERWRVLYGLNPMAGVVEGFRWALLGTEPPGTVIVASAAITIVGLGASVLYFQRVERSFDDVI